MWNKNKACFQGPLSMKSGEFVAVYLRFSPMNLSCASTLTASCLFSVFLMCYSLNQLWGLFWCIFCSIFSLFPSFCTAVLSLGASSSLLSLSLSTPLFNLPALTPLFLHCLCSVPLSSPTVVSGYGGEVVPTGRDKVPEGEAEPLRLSGRFHHCHHWKKAAAAAESDGAAAGGELQVQAVHTHKVKHCWGQSILSI